MPVCRWLGLTLDYIGAAIVFISIAASLLVAKHSSGITTSLKKLKYTYKFAHQSPLQKYSQRTSLNTLF
jgi:hypothetical protein